MVQGLPNQGTNDDDDNDDNDDDNDNRALKAGLPVITITV